MDKQFCLKKNCIVILHNKHVRARLTLLFASSVFERFSLSANSKKKFIFYQYFHMCKKTIYHGCLQLLQCNAIVGKPNWLTAHSKTNLSTDLTYNIKSELCVNIFTHFKPLQKSFIYAKYIDILNWILSLPLRKNLTAKLSNA